MKNWNPIFVFLDSFQLHMQSETPQKGEEMIVPTYFCLFETVVSLDLLFCLPFCLKKCNFGGMSPWPAEDRVAMYAKLTHVDSGCRSHVNVGGKWECFMYRMCI